MLLNHPMVEDRTERRQTRRPLTAEERAEGQRLKAIYERKKRELDLTQEKLAHLMGFQTQGAVSQYFNRLPMNNEIVIRFAFHLKVQPTEIRPKIWENLPTLPARDLDSDAKDFSLEYARATPEERKILRQTLDLMRRSREG